MRELKFRAWNDEAKKMYSPEELEQPEIQDSTKKTIYGYLSFGTLCLYDFSSVQEPTELFPLQSTGWTDKEMREIYEGDIVKIDEALHQIIWSEEVSGFIILSQEGMVVMGGSYLTDHMEIVGNIYENPELLEVENVTRKS